MSLAQQEEVNSLKSRIESLENRLGNVNYEMKGVVKSELVASASVLEPNQMQFGLYTALCLETIDFWKQNRVRWFSPIFHDPNKPFRSFPWALPVSNMGGFDDCGMTWVPPAGSKLCILFAHGSRGSPYYIGTTWGRDRGPGGDKFGLKMPEWEAVSKGHRGGYMVGPDDESQSLPPWNTENYNGFDPSSITDFAEGSGEAAQRLITYPNIYGFKTPEKHTIKMVDGDPKCNRKWKRFEIMSSCGNWIMLKDDHLHYAGQWAHKDCGVSSGDTSCVEGAASGSDLGIGHGHPNKFPEPTQMEDPDKIFGQDTDIISQADSKQEGDTKKIEPILGIKKETTQCNDNWTGFAPKNLIIGGHPSTGHPKTKYVKSQVGDNPYFKQKQECRPYKGPGTPQNPVVELPQSGIQFMSISGHTFVMDDSVEEPFGDPIWERSLQEFDFGCNNHYVGRTFWQSATGHRIEMSDVESPQGDAVYNEFPPNPHSGPGSKLRGKDNYIRILTASGNKIELNDHTVFQKDCPGYPPNMAGQERGIHIHSTSKHTIDMVDYTNLQGSPCRKDGGVPINKANRAFVKIRTGYGLEMKFHDDYDQTITQQQYIQIYCPHYDNTVRGPHIHRYQEVPSGPGLVFLRVGGNYVVSTYDNQISIIGDPEENPADKIEIISRIKLLYIKDVYINISDKLHLFLAKELILLLAGRDCDPPGGAGCCGTSQPCIAPVLVYDLCDGTIKISDRVYASTSPSAPLASIFMMSPFRKPSPPC